MRSPLVLSGCGMTLCPRYDEGGRYDGVDVSAFHPHPNPLPEETFA